MTIPDTMINEGTELCQKNVDRLIKDARLLHRNGSYGHALSSVMFAYDEYGKKLMLTLSLFPPRKGKQEILNRAFGSHGAKIGFTHMFYYLALIGETPSIKRFSSIKDTASIMEQLRGRGIFVEYKKRKWLDPNASHVKGDALFFVKHLENLITIVEPYIQEITKNVRSISISTKQQEKHQTKKQT